MKKKFNILMMIGYIMVPSLFIACGGWMAWGIKAFLPAFCVALGLDIIVGFVVNEYFLSRNLATMARLEEERMSYERGHVIGVSCPHCGERNLIPLDLEVDAFECTKCHVKNKMYFNFHAASIMDLDKAKVMEVLSQQKLEESRAGWDSLYEQGMDRQIEEEE